MKRLMIDNDRGPRSLRVLLLCVLLCWAVVFMVITASGAEPNLRQRVQVTVKTGASGDGVYLGGGIVAVDKHFVQGSLGRRASGSAGSGTVVSEGRGRGVGLIKLDSLAAPSPACGTHNYYRQGPTPRPAGDPSEGSEPRRSSQDSFSPTWSNR